MTKKLPAAFFALIPLLFPLMSQAHDQNDWPSDTADTKYLLVDRGFSSDISALYVSEQQDSIDVQLAGGSTPMSGSVIGPSTPVWTPLKDLGVQVWVLRSDGTALAQKWHSNASVGNAGWITDMMTFVFERAPADQIAAVVLRVNGKVFVRPIIDESQADTNPNSQTNGNWNASIASEIGPVRLIVQRSGKCLEAKAIPEQMVAATQQTCRDASAQQWTFHSVTTGYQILSASNSALCLNLRDATQTLGARVWLSACSKGGAPGQIWRVQAAGNGYNLIATHSGMCMDVSRGSAADGAAILQYTCHGSPNQIWTAQAREWHAIRLPDQPGE